MYATVKGMGYCFIEGGLWFVRCNSVSPISVVFLHCP